MLIRAGTHHTETKVVAVSKRVVAVTARNRAVVHKVVPITTDMHPKKVTVKKVTGVELVTLYILN